VALVTVGGGGEGHAQGGLGGVPLVGNRERWAPRIAQGIDTLVEHATHGFFGAAGEMPPRGGNPGLGDDQVRAAVVFMTSRAR
jgi:cytochrome c5